MTSTLAQSAPNTATQVLSTLCAVAAVLVSMMLAMFAVAFIMAALANSSQATVDKAKYLMLSIAVATVLCVTGSIVLMVKHQPWWAAGVGIAPAVTIVVLFILAFALGV